MYFKVQTEWFPRNTGSANAFSTGDHKTILFHNKYLHSAHADINLMPHSERHVRSVQRMVTSEKH